MIATQIQQSSIMCNDCIIILIFMSTLALSIYCLMILYLSIWSGVFRPISQSPNLFETIGKNVSRYYRTFDKFPHVFCLQPQNKQQTKLQPTMYTCQMLAMEAQQARLITLFGRYLKKLGRERSAQCLDQNVCLYTAYVYHSSWQFSIPTHTHS